MIALKNKDDDEPTNTDIIRSQKSTQESKKSSKESPMCSSCDFKDETPLSSDRDKWPIGKIENGCFHKICKLLDLTHRSKEPLMSALGGFDQATTAGIETKYELKGGMWIAEEVLGRWASRNQENNVGALKKILGDTMQRLDVLFEIEKWEKLSVCHGCGIKLRDCEEEEYRRAYSQALQEAPDAAMVEDSSIFRWPNETSSEASSSGSRSTGDSHRALKQGLNQGMSTRQDGSLHDACAKRHLHKVREILQKDSDIINRLNQRVGPLGDNPLHEAASRGHVDILQLLLNHGASVNA
ncbi:ankyrin repeat domain-containing 17, partial [Paramuricea clavata]